MNPEKLILANELEAKLEKAKEEKDIKTMQELLPEYEKAVLGLNQEGIDYNHYLTTIHQFLTKTYKGWSYTPEQLEIVEQVTENPDNIHIGENIPFEDLKKINEDEVKREANKQKAGEIYISGELIEDYEGKKVFIPIIPEDIKSKGLSAVLTHIHETYKDKYILPDITYMQYLCELRDQAQTETDETKKQALLNKIPTQLQDGNWCYFPGSAFVGVRGHWVSPYVFWSDSSFARRASGLVGSWDSGRRVVLLER